MTVISAQGVSQVLDSFDGEPTKYWVWIRSIKKYLLLADGDDNQSKRLAYQTSGGAVSDDIQRNAVEYPENSWEQLKSELNGRSAVVNDSHHGFTLLHKVRKIKKMSLFRFMQRGCMLWQIMHL